MERQAKIVFDKSEEPNESFEMIDINNFNNSNNVIKRDRSSSRENHIVFEEKASKIKKNNIPSKSKSHSHDDKKQISKKDNKNENSSVTESIDEIDHLINKIGSRAKVKIEDRSMGTNLDEDFTKSENTIQDKSDKNKNKKIDEILKKTLSKGKQNGSLENLNEKVSQKVDQVAVCLNSKNENDSTSNAATTPSKLCKNDNKNTESKSNTNTKKARDNQSAITRTKYIDPHVVNKQSTITNSELLLCILEVGIFPQEYGFKYKSKSKVFWEELCKKENFKNIFVKFKPETLKKYWSILSEIKECQKIVDIISNSKELIDSPDIKLLTLISNIVDNIKNSKSDFKILLSKLLKSKNSSSNLLGYKMKSGVELNRINDIDLEKDLLKTVDPENYDKLKLDELFEDNRKMALAPKESQIIRNRVILPNERDKNSFLDIDQIIAGLKLHFPEQERLEILEVLKKTSFNIANAYIYLKDPESNKNLVFSDMEDYIIKNMRKSEYYIELVKLKGRELIEEREKFLLVEEDL